MQYLSAQEILALHDLIIEDSGGSHGLRDAGLLQSASARPQTKIGGGDAFKTIFEKAATYLDSLAHHHVFVDGNKRTAFVSASAFLHRNGYEFTADDDEVVRFVLYVTTSRPDISNIAKWLEKYSKRVGR